MNEPKRNSPEGREAPEASSSAAAGQPSEPVKPLQERTPQQQREYELAFSEEEREELDRLRQDPMLRKLWELSRKGIRYPVDIFGE